MSERLQYWTKPRYYCLPSDAIPYDQEQDGIRIHESYRLDPSEVPDVWQHDGLPEGVGEYRIVVEAEVEEQEDCYPVRRYVAKLAPDLDKLWTYVTGKPLFFLQQRLEVVDAPSRWETNFDAVQARLTNIQAEFGISSGPVALVLPSFPLEAVLNLRRAYETCDDALHKLVELHYESLILRSSHARLLVLAKALELADSLIPGRRKAKEAHLSDETVKALTQSFDWLFNVANNRVDIRHVVRRGATKAQLHPNLSLEEREDFISNGDLVVRDIICDGFGIERVRYRNA